MRRALAAGIAAAGVASAASFFVYHQVSDRVTPASQPALARLAKDDIGPVRDLFNASAGAPRVLVMLSPT